MEIMMLQSMLDLSIASIIELDIRVFFPDTLQKLFSMLDVGLQVN